MFRDRTGAGAGAGVESLYRQGLGSCMRAETRRSHSKMGQYLSLEQEAPLNRQTDTTKTLPSTQLLAGSKLHLDSVNGKMFQ